MSSARRVVVRPALAPRRRGKTPGWFQPSMRQLGIGVVETMVGIVVGMVVTLVIYQMFVGFEGQRRVTLGTATAQQTGAYALSVLGRDIGMAGWGSVAAGGLTCNDAYTWDAVAGSMLAAGLSMQPVVVINGAGGASDTVIVNRGTSLRAGTPLALQGNMSSAQSAVRLASTTGFQPGDLIWVLEGSKCTLMEISAIDAVQGLLSHDSAPDRRYNPTSVSGWPVYTTAATAYGMGRIVSNRYKVVGGDLVMNNLTSIAGSTGDDIVAANVVNLQAQYGLSATRSSPQVTQWVDGGVVPNLDAARIRAVRIAVLTRVDEAARVDTSGNCPVRAAPVMWPGGGAFDMSGVPNWMCHRYRVHQTVIPLRNILLAF